MFRANGIGRFVAKPELRQTPNGTNVTRFTIVFNERVKVKDEIIERPHFFDFEAWDKGAEVICQHFDKGDVINIVSATPRQEKWEDKETQQKRSKVSFRVNEFAFVPYNSKKDKEVKVEANKEGTPF